jgi:hypothetical protein
MGAISSVNLLLNHIGVDQAKALVSILKEHSTLKSLCGNTGNETELDMSQEMCGAGDTIMLVPEIIDNGALFSLDLSGSSIMGADGVASLTAALKRHAIEHQRPCISIQYSILLGDQDQHLLAHTKDLRALLVATSNLNPSHCMPVISAYLLKEIAEWL